MADDEDSDEDVLDARLEQAQTSDDWRLLLMDLDDALVKLEEYICANDTRQTPSKNKREVPSAMREVCSLVDTLIRQHTKCSEDGMSVDPSPLLLTCEIVPVIFTTCSSATDFEQIQGYLNRAMQLLPRVFNLQSITLTAQATACDTLMKLGNLYVVKYFAVGQLREEVAATLVSTSDHIFQLSKESLKGNNVSSAQTMFIDCCSLLLRTICGQFATLADALIMGNVDVLLKSGYV